MRDIMYLRPGNLYKDFSVEECRAVVNEKGRTVLEYDTTRNRKLRGCLASAKADEILRFGQIGHPVTHIIVQNGRRRAKEDDRLHTADRTFIVRAIDEAGSLGVCTIYYVEERTDVK